MENVLKKFTQLSNSLYVNGNYTSSTSTSSIDVIDPATENKLGEIAETTPNEIENSLDLSKQSQKKWWKLSALDRAHRMHEVADKMISMRSILAEALTREMGKPYKESADEVDWSAHSIRHSAEMGRNDMGRVMEDLRR